jgi:alpha-L-arabinofuranosidase
VVRAAGQRLGSPGQGWFHRDRPGKSRSTQDRQRFGCDCRGAGRAGEGEVLTADAMDAHNTFESPEAIHPVVFDGAKLDGNKLSVTLPAKSVVVLKLQ